MVLLFPRRSIQKTYSSNLKEREDNHYITVDRNEALRAATLALFGAKKEGKRMADLLNERQGLPLSAL